VIEPDTCICDHDDDTPHAAACPMNDDGPMNDDWIEAHYDAAYRAAAWRARRDHEAIMGHLK
jgi:hypothetical protein